MEKRRFICPHCGEPVKLGEVVQLEVDEDLMDDLETREVEELEEAGEM